MMTTAASDVCETDHFIALIGYKSQQNYNILLKHATFLSFFLQQTLPSPNWLNACEQEDTDQSARR